MGEAITVKERCFDKCSVLIDCVGWGSPKKNPRKSKCLEGIVCSGPILGYFLSLSLKQRNKNNLSRQVSKVCIKKQPHFVSVGELRDVLLRKKWFLVLALPGLGRGGSPLPKFFGIFFKKCMLGQ